MAFNQEITVAEHHIGRRNKPFIIAEMSGNHNGSLERALEIVEAVASSGAQALKLQTYTADTITINVDQPQFKVKGDHALWGDRSLYDLYSQAHTPWEWHKPIFDKARELGLVPFSTPFDPTSIEFLEGLGTELYKTASAEIVDLPLLREIASTGKPMIVSTGMASLSEIEAAVKTVSAAGCNSLVLLACTASYPADPHDARLANIEVLEKSFGVPVGLSDHTLGIGVAVAAIARGAVCVEKHVALKRSDGGVDSDFSLTPDELALLVSESHAAQQACASEASFGPVPGEETMLRLRRSLYIVEDAQKGELVTEDNVRSIRPAGGLEPVEFDKVAGRRFTKSVVRGTPLTWDVL